MLCPLREIKDNKVKKKCYKYWPDDKECRFGEYKVTTLETTKVGDLVTRKLGIVIERVEGGNKEEEKEGGPQQEVLMKEVTQIQVQTTDSYYLLTLF